MNTQLENPEAVVPTSEAPGHTIGVYVETPVNFTAAVCLTGPLRRLLELALHNLLLDKPSSVPVLHGAYLLLRVSDISTAFEIIRAELEGLGYHRSAHVGCIEAEGWRALYGRPDTVLSFDGFWDIATSAMQFEQLSLHDHLLAAIRTK